MMRMVWVALWLYTKLVIKDVKRLDTLSQIDDKQYMLKRIEKALQSTSAQCNLWEGTNCSRLYIKDDDGWKLGYISENGALDYKAMRNSCEVLKLLRSAGLEVVHQDGTYVVQP